LAGSLKREIKARYAIRPTMRHQYHELEVLVNGRSVFCYTKAQGIPTVQSLVQLVEEAANTGTPVLVQSPNQRKS
jgi:hypothetical protein